MRLGKDAPKSKKMRLIVPFNGAHLYFTCTIHASHT